MMPGRRTARGVILVLGLALQACFDDDATPTPDAPPRDAPAIVQPAFCADSEPGAPSADIAAALRRVPGIADVVEIPASEGDRFFTLTFRQLVDHSEVGGPTFKQRVTVIHHGAAAPVILGTQGYDLAQTSFREEPTVILGANQVEVEHRYFLPSQPSPVDWSKLTIWQAAADDHCLIRALDRIYPSVWIGTGQSKGGMAALFHRRFFPDDTIATIAYVTPLSLGAPDPRYVAAVESGTHPECRQRLRDFQRLALSMRSSVENRMGTLSSVTFDTLGVDVAFEHLVLELPFGFWQYDDVSSCNNVPGAGATSDAVFAYLDQVGQVSLYGDALVAHYAPYYVQAATQLGYPEIDESNLAAMLQHPGTDTPIPYLPEGASSEFDPTAMDDIRNWVQTAGSRLLFIYGQNDPWSGGMIQLGAATDSFRLIVAEGNHDSLIADLSTDDQKKALDAIRRWAKLPAKASMLVPAPRERYHAQRHAAYP